MAEEAYMQSQQTTYVIHPPSSGTKRRKVQEDQFVAGEGKPLDSVPFVRLLQGKEPYEHATMRYEMYVASIQRQEQATENIFNELSTQTLRDIEAKIGQSVTKDRLDTLLLLSNSSIAASTVFLEQLRKHLEKKSQYKIVTLNSKEATTMRLALKTIVNGVIGDAVYENGDTIDISDDDDDDEEFKVLDKRLSWDLGVAHEWFQAQWSRSKDTLETTDTRLVLILEDIDSYNVTLLNRLLKLINSFSDRIPFKLIFNVGTNIQSFANKLSSDVVINMDFHKFKIEQTDEVINKIVMDVVMSEEFLINEDLAKFILERFRMSVKNSDEFLKMLKYAKMTFFFNNPLIVMPMLTENEILNLPQEYFDALKMLPSFKRYIAMMLDRQVEPEKVEKLLQDQGTLTKTLLKSKSLYETYLKIFKDLFSLIVEVLVPRSYKSEKNYLEFYCKLSSKDEFVKIQFINEMMSLLKTIELSEMEKMMVEINDKSKGSPAISALNKEVKLKANFRYLSSLPRDTPAEVYNYKIEARKVIETFVQSIDSFLRSKITSSDKILFNELFRMSDTDVVKLNLVPAVRATIQETLINYEQLFEMSRTGIEPLDELNNLMNPAMTDMLTIYRETNLHLNIYDYYTSYKNSLDKQRCMLLINAILDHPDGLVEKHLNDPLRFKYIYQFFNDIDMPEDEKWDRLTLTFFLQKCEELLYCGFFKQIKKKGELLEKSIWKDL